MLGGFLTVLAVLWIFRAFNVVLSLSVIPRLPDAARRPSGAPLVSVVVPARNEERDVGEATRSKCRLDDPSFEVLVVEDRSTDGTRAVLSGIEDEFPRLLRVLDGEEPSIDWLGKPHALDEGARAARAQRPDEWLLFSDADVLFQPDLLARALAHVEREKLDFLTLFPELLMGSFGERFMTPSIAVIGFCYLPGWLMNVPGARNFGGGGGVFNLVRRELFDRIGGHAALKRSIIDDVQLGRNARRGGGRTGAAWGRDVLSIRMYHGFVETAKGFAKNGYYGIGGNLPAAVAFLALFLLEGTVPFVALAVAAAGSPLVSHRQAVLAAIVVGLTLLVRGALHVQLRYPLVSVLLHPFWVASVTGIFAWSTYVNGVLGRNTWRGRSRDARTLGF